MYWSPLAIEVNPLPHPLGVQNIVHHIKNTKMLTQTEKDQLAQM